MKTFDRAPVGGVRFVRPVLLALAVGGLAIQGQAQTYVLSGGNSSIQVNLGGTPGVSDWVVDGVNQLNQQWFYYRVGSTGPEFSINNIVASPTINMATATKVDATYAAGGYSVRTVFALTGEGIGTHDSNLAETITIHNASATDHLHFFQYADFDLGNQTGNQTAQFSANAFGNYYQVVQSDNLGNQVTELIGGAASGLVHVQAGLVDGTLLTLGDANPTTLNDTLSAGPGNTAWAYEWDVAPGGNLIISKLITVVPEPSSLALILLGGAAFVRLLRRHRAE
jgi:PEP-CTERM motif